MSLLFARAIAALEPPYRGVHLMWSGPSPFVFAPGGWVIERRNARALEGAKPTCEEVSGPSLARLRSRLAVSLKIGALRLMRGVWNGPEPGPCEVFTIELTQPSSRVSGAYRGRHGLAVGLFNGKAVAYQFLPFATDGRKFEFGSAPVDQVVVYGLNADAVRCCVAPSPLWSDGKVVARLQLPLREFDPSLQDDASELATARARLLLGEVIDARRFKALADTLRVALRGPGRRPMDHLLRMQGESSEPEDMAALGPLRTLLVNPTWRRVMGMGYVDRDPTMVPGASYDYRITGLFPKAEADSRVFGFHTLPVGLLLPADFSLGNCRFRLPQPSTVQVARGIPRNGAQWVTRCGIPLVPRGSLGWSGVGIENFSMVIDLPAPVTRLVLELDKGHRLRFAAGDGTGSLSPEAAVPAGDRPTLQFAVPVTQLCLSGAAFLFALRLPGSDDSQALEPAMAVLSAVNFVDTPRPAAPQEVVIDNLQRDPAAAMMSGRQPSVRRLHSLGIQVRWRPAPAAGLPFWPTDMAVPAPLDATTFQVERRIEPAGAYTPVLAGPENMMLGSRDEPAASRTVVTGIDLLQLYPEDAPPRRGREEFSYVDAFRAPSVANPAERKPPPPGSVLRYRVRTVDVIGRPSLDARESNAARLEKHEPPPQPGAYDARSADQLGSPGPTGVYARVLVRGAADLTPQDLATLGSSDNAILLRWGWRAQQRNQDPLATQFRVYLTRAVDQLAGEVISVNAVPPRPGDWTAQLRLSQPVTANAAAGLVLDVGYPFTIIQHTAGLLPQVLLRTRIPDAAGQMRKPALGRCRLPLKLHPAMTQPASWAERLMVMPITAAQQYQAVIRDRLLLSADHPRDGLWLGVSSADGQDYVADTFAGGTLPGNESAIVAVSCEARRVFRPVFQPPLPAGPVARLRAPEPAGTEVVLDLDLGPYVTGAGLVAGQRVQPERLAISALFAALKQSGAQLMGLGANPADAASPARPFGLANPADQAAVLAAVRAGSSAVLEDRLAVAVAAVHPYADQLFKLATPAAVPFGPFAQTLPPGEERFLYRLRLADSEQRLSASAVVANAVLRVPSLAPGAAPQRTAALPNDPPGRLRLRTPADPRTTHLASFQCAVLVPGEAELLRVPNRADMAPGAALRLRLANGALLEPAVQPLPTGDASGRLSSVDANGAPGQVVSLWAASLSADGMPSSLSGPWRITLPRPALLAPQLSVVVATAGLAFNWTLLDPLHSASWLEVSEDGTLWQRASAARARGLPTDSASLPRPPGPARKFRAVASSLDGRRATSNVVSA